MSWALVAHGLSLVRFRGLLGALPILIFLAVRQVAGAEAAIILGFSASLAVYLFNRAQSGAILALSTLAVSLAAIAAAVALWQGDERFYFAGDPAWDFVMAGLAFGSLAVRRPLAGPVIHELVPRVKEALEARQAVFYVVTLLVGLLFLFHGVVRTSLLLAEDSIERYIVVSRLVQWPTVALMVLLIIWLIRRSLERNGGGDQSTPFSSGADV